MESLKSEILGLSDEWARVMQLSHYTSVHTFEDLHPEEPEPYAETSVLWQYRHADITWYVDRIANDINLLENIVVHELTHLTLASLVEHVSDRYLEQSEFAVESVARALIGARNGRS